MSQVYLYGSDIIPFIGTLGVSGPIYDLLRSAQTGQTVSQKLAEVSTSLVGMLGLALVILWFLLRTYVKNNSLIEKLSFIGAFNQQIGKAINRLPVILDSDNPMPLLVKLQEEIILPAADRALGDGIYSVDHQLTKEIKEESKRLADESERDYSARWNIPTNPELRS